MIYRSPVPCIPWTLFACNAIETDLLEADGTANSPVTVGEKVWEVVSFRGKIFFGRNMRRGQKVGQQVPLWGGTCRKKLGDKKWSSVLYKKGTIGISSKVSQHALIAGDQSCRLSGFGGMVPNGSAKSGPKNGPNLTKASKKASAVFCHHSG